MNLSDSHPVVLAFPFLALTQPVSFRSWWVGPVDQFQGPWLSPDFETAARTFLSAFRDSDGQPVGGGALVARLEGGADGRPPTSVEWQGLELAVGYATVHQNPYWTPAASTEGWRVATADNAAFWIQPLNLAEGWITLGRGSRVSISSGGNNLNRDAFAISAPLELNMPLGVTLDQEVVEAVYQVVVEPTPRHKADASRVRVSARWLLRSWQNTPSITWEDRLVFIKVATEALTGKESTAESAKELEALFERAAGQDGDGLGTDDLLWQPGQPEVVRSWTTRSGAARSETVSAFVHWHGALGDARNALVHGEDGAPLDYRQAGSPYEGPFVEIGDRIVREAIAVLLGECGYPAVWRRGLSRASFRALQHLRRLSEDEAAEQPTSSAD